jgi:hypothetical protein
VFETEGGQLLRTVAFFRSQETTVYPFRVASALKLAGPPAQSRRVRVRS